MSVLYRHPKLNPKPQSLHPKPYTPNLNYSGIHTSLKSCQTIGVCRARLNEAFVKTHQILNSADKSKPSTRNPKIGTNLSPYPQQISLHPASCEILPAQRTRFQAAYSRSPKVGNPSAANLIRVMYRVAQGIPALIVLNPFQLFGVYCKPYPKP